MILHVLTSEGLPSAIGPSSLLKARPPQKTRPKKPGLLVKHHTHRLHSSSFRLAGQCSKSVVKSNFCRQKVTSKTHTGQSHIDIDNDVSDMRSSLVLGHVYEGSAREHFLDDGSCVARTITISCIVLASYCLLLSDHCYFCHRMFLSGF